MWVSVGVCGCGCACVCVCVTVQYMGMIGFSTHWEFFVKFSSVVNFSLFS